MTWEHEQLLDLARPFPQRVVHTKPGGGGGSYVSHAVYTQRLLLHLGAYSFTLVEVIRGHVAGKPPNPDADSAKGRAGSPDLDNAIVGVVMRLSVTIDGRDVVIEDVGDCEQPHNWPTDGARLKDATSDALKRCCARIGLGTHLYEKATGEFFLADSLKRKRDADQPEGPDQPEAT